MRGQKGMPFEECANMLRRLAEEHPHEALEAMLTLQTHVPELRPKSPPVSEMSGEDAGVRVLIAVIRSQGLTDSAILQTLAAYPERALNDVRAFMLKDALSMLSSKLPDDAKLSTALAMQEHVMPWLEQQWLAEGIAPTTPVPSAPTASSAPVVAVAA